jgi:hypothetical protein
MGFWGVIFFSATVWVRLWRMWLSSRKYSLAALNHEDYNDLNGLYYEYVNVSGALQIASGRADKQPC